MKMRMWVGDVNRRFYPHAAQFDFEAWLLPYWNRVAKIAGHNRKAPPGSPESVNHGKPASYHIKDAFRRGTCGRHYSKTRDAAAILRDQDLMVAAVQCPELRAFLNTILTLSGGEAI